MGHPLAIARCAALPDATPVDIAKIDAEAGVPVAPALRLFSTQVGSIFNGVTKAGGTDQRTVTAIETTRLDSLPVSVIEVIFKYLNSLYGYSAFHRLFGICQQGIGSRKILRISLIGIQLRHDCMASI